MKKLIIMLIISLAAHITIAGTLIYIPSYLTNNNRGFDNGGVIWGIVGNKEIGGPGEGRGKHGKTIPFGSGTANIRKEIEKKIEEGIVVEDNSIRDPTMNNQMRQENYETSMFQDNTKGIENLDIENLSSDNIISDGCYDSSICVGENTMGEDTGIGNFSPGDGDAAEGGGIYGNNGGIGIKNNFGVIGHNSGNALNGFLIYIKSEIERHKYYPHMAKVQELEGTVYVNFHIDESGKPSSIVVGRPSGSKLLDESAVSTIKKIRHFKGVPEEIRELDISVPITYRLTKEDKE